MTITINGVEVSTEKDVLVNRTAQEAFDFGKITVISTIDKRYETYDKVDITTVYGTEQYLVQADEKNQINATEYEHTLTLFENIAYFDSIYPASRPFKIIGQTVGDILSVYKTELETYHNITITYTDLTTDELNTIIAFKEFDGVEFSNILITIFSKIPGAPIPKVNRNGMTWEIYTQYLSTRNELLSDVTTSNSSTVNNIDYATKVKSQLKNAVNERDENDITWFPSETGYVLPKPSTIENVSSNLRYELDSKIIEVLKAQATDVPVEVLRLSDNATITIQVDDINIPNIVPNEVYDNLLVITSDTPSVIIQSDNIKDHVRYKIGDRYITDLFGAGTGGAVFNANTTYLLNAIERELYLNWTDYIDDTLYTFQGLLRAGGYDTDEVKMRFKYVRQRDLDIVHTRKTKGSMNESTTIHQQRDASVETREQTKSLQLYSNRMGNETRTYNGVYDYGDTLPQLFDYIDESRVVTTVNYTFKANIINVEYEISENFANLQADTALRRSTDPYSITSKSLTTNLVSQEYIEFSFSDKTDATRLTSDGQRLALGMFEATTLTQKKVSQAIFKPVLASWNSLYGIQMPVETSGDGNLLTMHVFFENNVIAAKTFYDLDADTLQSYLNPLPYTDTDGTLDNFELYFTEDVLIEDDGRYPLITSETAHLAATLTEDGLQEPINLDQSAAFAYTFQLHLIADDNIYIGNALARKNYLITKQLTSTAIKIYTSDKPYGQYNQVPRSTDTDSTATITYAYSFANKTITITPSSDIQYWSIVKDGEILLAMNQPVSSGNSAVIHINFIQAFNVLYLSASVIGLASISGTASILYSARTYYIAGSATGLSSITGTASIEYTTRSYFLNASATGLANVTGTALIDYLSRDYFIQASAINLSTISGTADIDYSSVANYIAASAINLSNVTGTAELDYTTQNPFLNASATGLANVSGTADLNVPASLVEWEIVQSGTVTGGTCLFVSDVGNIKEETSNSCSFVNNGSTFISSTDLSESQPACGTGVTYTTCFPELDQDLNPTGDYVCQEKIGTITSQTFKYECVLK